MSLERQRGARLRGDAAAARESRAARGRGGQRRTKRGSIVTTDRRARARRHRSPATGHASSGEIVGVARARARVSSIADGARRRVRRPAKFSFLDERIVGRRGRRRSCLSCGRRRTGVTEASRRSSSRERSRARRRDARGSPRMQGALCVAKARRLAYADQRVARASQIQLRAGALAPPPRARRRDLRRRRGKFARARRAAATRRRRLGAARAAPSPSAPRARTIAACNSPPLRDRADRRRVAAPSPPRPVASAPPPRSRRRAAAARRSMAARRTPICRRAIADRSAEGAGSSAARRHLPVPRRARRPRLGGRSRAPGFGMHRATCSRADRPGGSASRADEGPSEDIPARGRFVTSQSA